MPIRRGVRLNPVFRSTTISGPFSEHFVCSYLFTVGGFFPTRNELGPEAEGVFLYCRCLFVLCTFVVFNQVRVSILCSMQTHSSLSKGRKVHTI